MSMTPLLIKMNGLETDQLQAIQAHIETLLAGRLDTNFGYGREAWFNSSKAGIGRMEVIIDGVNRTTVSCHEKVSGKKWRVGKTMLNVYPIERKVILAARLPKMPTPVYKPATSGAAW